MKHPKFGDIIVNVSAAKENPRKISTFVRVIRKKGKVNAGIHYECTDRKGNFWLVDPVCLNKEENK